MERYLTKFTIATAISICGIGIHHNHAHSAALYIGRYGYFTQDINLIGFIPESKLIEQITNSQNKNLIIVEQHQLETSALMHKIDVLAPGKPLKKQIEQEYSDFQHKASEATRDHTNSQAKPKSSDLTGIANADRINQNIEARYQGFIETKSEKINLFVANKINKQILADNQEKKQLAKSLLEETFTTLENNNLFPKSLTTGVILAISGAGLIIFIPIINAFFALDEQGNLIFSGWKFGKSKVPDSAIALHNQNFKEISNLAKKATKIDNEKFSNREFILYLKLRAKVHKG